MISAAQVEIADPYAACPCGSSKPGRECCLDERGRIRGVPAAIPAPRLGPAESTTLRCYAAPIGGCSPQLSGEHYLSHAILRRMTNYGGGQLQVSKMAWLPPGKSLRIPPSQLKAKVLCTAHNAALSPYDGIGDRFYELLLKTGEPANDARTATGLFNGEDLERWFLKTLCGVTAMEAEVKGAQWCAPKPWLEALLKLNEAMPSGAGLWLNLGGFWMFPDGAPSMSATPIDDPRGGDPAGLRLHFCGMEFVFLMSHEHRRWVRNGRLRPGLLSFQTPGYCGVHIGISYRYSPLGIYLQGQGTPAPRNA